MVLLQRKQYFSKDPEGVQHFLGGPAFSRGCPNAYFYRNSYKLRFSRGRGIRTAYPPLDPHMHKCAVGLIDMGGGSSTFSWGGGP